MGSDFTCQVRCSRRGQSHRKRRRVELEAESPAGQSRCKRTRVELDGKSPALSEDEEIRLALALSQADHEESKRKNKEQEESELRRRGAKPCYICKLLTLAEIRLEDPDCPHVACSLEHLFKA